VEIILQMFIDVLKLNLIEDKDGQGNPIENPKNDKKIYSKVKTYRETIRIDEIKSAKTWYPSPEHKALLKKELTMIYLFGNSKSDKPANMIIDEPLDSFSKRLSSIQLNDNDGGEI
jgi:hypothetical protein